MIVALLCLAFPALLIYAAARWVAVWRGLVPLRAPEPAAAAPVSPLPAGDGMGITQAERGVQS